MKKILQHIVIITLTLSLFSCKTMHKFTIYGTPNSKIYNTDGGYLTTLNSKGEAKVKVPANAYYGMLLSQNPQSGEMVPFAVDYKHNAYIGNKVCKGLMVTCSSAGMLTSLVGLIALADGSEDIGVPFLLGGFGGGLLPLLFFGPSAERLDQYSYDYQFSYYDKQHTNGDLTFTQPDLLIAKYTPQPQDEEESTKTTKSSVTASKPDTHKKNTDTSSSSKSTKQVSEKSTKTLKNYGAQVEGEFVGTGSLTLQNTTVETYANIKVVIERIDNDRVSVQVIEENGDEFFNTPSEYNVVKNNDNTYTLTNSGISVAKITIDKANKMVYLHPRVNIDDSLYQLNINAKRK